MISDTQRHAVRFAVALVAILFVALALGGCAQPAPTAPSVDVTTVTPTPSAVASESTAAAPTKVTVPNLKGKTATGATWRLEQLGLKVKEKWTRDSAPRGRVIAQKPRPGKVRQGSTVTITISSGNKGSGSGSSGGSSGGPTASSSDEYLAQLFAQHKSGETVTGKGNVTRVLSDDNDGSRHQRFILALGSGQTLLIAHNIDIAPRLPGLQVGDAVSFKGTYEWGAEGGTVHWTHRDPSGDHVTGYLKYDGKTYK